MSKGRRIRPDGRARMAAGILFRLGSVWVGAHWSAQNRRLCINLLPCCTLWLVWPGGRRP
ncbi:MAG: hypothetical protein J0H84_18445 [Rhizobiales bacterium]|nr:hypothetical protein [Hyphomicrobiales bacterium]